MQTLLASNMRLAAELRSRDLADAERRRMAMEQQAFEQHPLTRARQVVEKHQEEVLKRAAKPISMAKLDKEYEDAQAKSNWQRQGEEPMDQDVPQTSQTASETRSKEALKKKLAHVSVQTMLPQSKSEAVQTMMAQTKSTPSQTMSEPKKRVRHRAVQTKRMPLAPSGVIAEEHIEPKGGKRKREYRNRMPVAKRQKLSPAPPPFQMGMSTSMSADIDAPVRKRPRKLVGPPATVPFLFPA
eukprot:jgi/Chrzof1/14273/Cz08g31250.t1